jgi:hypothetical protein
VQENKTMSGSSPNRARDEARQRFYQNQRASPQCSTPNALASVTEGEAAAGSPETSAVNSASSLFSTVAPLDSLEAFMNSREEDALGLLSTFTQLTVQDKLKALQQVEGGAFSESDDDGASANSAAPGNAGKRTANAKKNCANSAVLRRRLLEREREHRRLKLQQTKKAERHVDVHNIESADAARPMLSMAHIASVSDADNDGLETMVLEEGTHTGNLVAFFDKGVTDVSTTFDNFFEPIADVAEAAHGMTMSKAAPPPPQPVRPSSSAAMLTLDNILAIDSKEEDGEREGDAPRDVVTHSSPPPCESGMTAPTAEESSEEAVVRRSVHRATSSSSASSPDSSSTSSGGSMVLPGLDDSDVDIAQEGAMRPTRETQRKEATSLDVTADLQQVIAEHDDCVQTFALDPLFDYDADVVGEAFRTAKMWRQ